MNDQKILQERSIVLQNMKMIKDMMMTIEIIDLEDMTTIEIKDDMMTIGINREDTMMIETKEDMIEERIMIKGPLIIGRIEEIRESIIEDQVLRREVEDLVLGNVEDLILEKEKDLQVGKGKEEEVDHLGKIEDLVVKKEMVEDIQRNLIELLIKWRS